MRALILLLATTSVVAADPSDELTLGSSTRALRSASADAITDQGYVGGALGFARLLQVPTIPNVSLWATAGFAWGGTSGEMFQNLATDVSTLGLTVGGRVRYAPYAHLAVSARLELGSQHASLELTDRNARTASDGGWGTMATVGAAVDLFAVHSESFALGIRFELGYTVTQGIALAPKSPHDETTLSLMTTSASIGHLDLGGPTFSLAAITQF